MEERKIKKKIGQKRWKKMLIFVFKMITI